MSFIEANMISRATDFFCSGQSFVLGLSATAFFQLNKYLNMQMFQAQKAAAKISPELFQEPRRLFLLNPRSQAKVEFSNDLLIYIAAMYAATSCTARIVSSLIKQCKRKPRPELKPEPEVKITKKERLNANKNRGVNTSFFVEPSVIKTITVKPFLGGKLNRNFEV
jgi:hypothetical protein